MLYATLFPGTNQLSCNLQRLQELVTISTVHLVKARLVFLPLFRLFAMLYLSAVVHESFDHLSNFLKDSKLHMSQNIMLLVFALKLPFLCRGHERQSSILHNNLNSWMDLMWIIIHIFGHIIQPVVTSAGMTAHCAYSQPIISLQE